MLSPRKSNTQGVKKLPPSQPGDIAQSPGLAQSLPQLQRGCDPALARAVPPLCPQAFSEQHPPRQFGQNDAGAGGAALSKKTNFNSCLTHEGKVCWQQPARPRLSQGWAQEWGHGAVTAVTHSLAQQLLPLRFLIPAHWFWQQTAPSSSLGCPGQQSPLPCRAFRATVGMWHLGTRGIAGWAFPASVILVLPTEKCLGCSRCRISQ